MNNMFGNSVFGGEKIEEFFVRFEPLNQWIEAQKITIDIGGPPN
jgi:hypothetical protein